MAKLFAIKFEAAEKYVERTLGDKEFQIDDSFWRCYNNMIFDFLIEKLNLTKGSMLQINIDYTTIREDFLVLVASVTINKEKSVMLNFSMRNYPKKKGQVSLKKMEEAFLKALKHILPKGYEYVITADRGFGNHRIISLCKELGFRYILRLSDNLNVIVNGKEQKLSNFVGQNASFLATVKTWKETLQFCVSTQKSEQTQEESTWYIVSDLKVGNIEKMYAQRFKIEKLFQDFKSSGFCIEKSKIKKYDRMKRLLFCIGFAHAIATFVGFFLRELKEKMPNHYWAITACSKLERSF
jgi:hypothetical protein